MEWRSVKEKPECADTNLGVKENNDLIVWVAEHRTAQIGRCIEYGPDDYEFSANGYNGKWNITHWCYIEAPK